MSLISELKEKEEKCFELQDFNRDLLRHIDELIIEKDQIHDEICCKISHNLREFAEEELARLEWVETIPDSYAKWREYLSHEIEKNAKLKEDCLVYKAQRDTFFEEVLRLRGTLAFLTGKNRHLLFKRFLDYLNRRD